MIQINMSQDLTLAEKIKRFKAETKKTYTQMAAEAGVSYDNLVKWKDGTKPGGEDYTKIANYINGKLESENGKVENGVSISKSDLDILRMLAESNLKLSNSHAEMVQMLKQRMVIPNSDLMELKANQMAILTYLKTFSQQRAESHGPEAAKVLGETGKAIAGNAGLVQKKDKSVESKKHNS